MPTIPGRDELQWLDIIRRPTAAANVEGVATFGGFSSLLGEKEKTTKYGNRDEIDLETVKPISFELGGRPGPQTMTVLQGLTTQKPVVERELNSATALRKLTLTSERTLT